MQLKMETSCTYRPWDGRHSVSYTLLNVEGQQIQANSKRLSLPQNDPLLLSLRAVEFGVQALHYIDADNVTVYSDEPAVVAWLDGACVPRRGYRQTVTRIRQRLRMLPAQVTFRWGMGSEREHVRQKAQTKVLPLSA